MKFKRSRKLIPEKSYGLLLFQTKKYFPGLKLGFRNGILNAKGWLPIKGVCATVSTCCFDTDLVIITTLPNSPLIFTKKKKHEEVPKLRTRIKLERNRGKKKQTCYPQRKVVAATKHIDQSFFQ